MKSPDQIPSKSLENFRFQVGESTVPSEYHPERNEDALLSLSEKGAFAVFDGLGGRVAGDVASGMTRDYVKKAIEKMPDSLSTEERKIKIEEIFKDANEHILKTVDKDASLYKMGTTVSFAQFCKDANGVKKIIVANAGDSRVYIFRNGKVLEHASVDDNYLSPEMRIKFNDVTSWENLAEWERSAWKERHHLDNPLGRSDFAPQMSVHDLHARDIVLITSDGIHDNLTDAEIAQILSGKGSNSMKANLLVKSAEERSREGVLRSKPDDMTAIVVGEVS